jgi:DNA-binding response OmpR family regulator
MNTHTKYLTMKKCVSVLEDNDELRELFIFILESEQYLVKSYPNVTKFLAALQENLPDIFLLDIMLPDGDGLEICKKLKSDRSTMHIPVIMMSAHRNNEQVRSSCSAEDFIAKPFDIDDLIQKVDQYVS